MRLSTLIQGESTRAVSSRRAIMIASSTVLVGLAMVGMRPPDPNDLTIVNLGMAVTLVSLLLLIAGIHYYGRLGPQDADERDVAD
jgi:hypothetical protein